MSEEQKCDNCEALRALYESAQKFLMHYLESYKEVVVLPLSGGRAAKIEIKGKTPVTSDDIVLIIAHLQFIKRQFAKEEKQ